MTNTSFWKTFVTLAVFVSIVFLCGPEASAQKGDSADDVRITVYLIEASDGNPGVDREIRSIVKQLRGTFRYSTYRLVSKSSERIRIGDFKRIALPGQRGLHVFARGRKEGRIKLKVKIAEKPTHGSKRDMLNTEFRIVKGGTIIIGGYNYQKGKLIVAISADE